MIYVAVTDEETTGLDERVHEIIEIGIIVVRFDTLEVDREDTFKVKPARIDKASPEALRINGYNEEEWRDALGKPEALHRYGDFVGNAQFGGWNPGFDRRFLRALERETDVYLDLDHHEHDIATLAREHLRDSGLRKLKLDVVAQHLGFPEEPKPHRALSGARLALQVWRELRNRGL